MAWTYDTTLPTDKDKIRLLIGDTLSVDQQLSDEEIESAMTVYGSVRGTAIAMLRILAARYARYADKWVGDLKILASQKANAYLKLADKLETSTSVMGSMSGIPSAGGIYISEKESMEGNENRVVPFFRRGLHDDESSE